jgi:hypothetical protein
MRFLEATNTQIVVYLDTIAVLRHRKLLTIVATTNFVFAVIAMIVAIASESILAIRALVIGGISSSGGGIDFKVASATVRI